jgi:hypothetical protein
MKLETVVTLARFSLGSGKRVFLIGVGMQKNRKILSDLAVAFRQELVGSRAHDAPVPLFNRQSKLLIPNSTTNKVNFHLHKLS